MHMAVDSTEVLSVCNVPFYLFFMSHYSGEKKWLLSLYMCVRMAICSMNLKTWAPT